MKSRRIREEDLVRFTAPGNVQAVIARSVPVSVLVALRDRIQARIEARERRQAAAPQR